MITAQSGRSGSRFFGQRIYGTFVGKSLVPRFILPAAVPAKPFDLNDRASRTTALAIFADRGRVLASPVG